ncbi:transposase [Streptomyces sp. NPDC013978]|uniref:transposase n=1 Tax=Streptomyces sp. NPDC013978 TaxID=3364869 RepID=UPI0037018CB1
MEREPYPSDLSDEQWSMIEPMITAWKQDRVARSATGDPGSCDLREVVNAIFYQNRTDCQWRYLRVCVANGGTRSVFFSGVRR